MTTMLHAALAERQQTRDYATRLGVFVLARLADDRTLAASFHVDDCHTLSNARYWGDADCDCSGSEFVTERVDAMLSAVQSLLAMVDTPLPVLEALAAPWGDHRDYPQVGAA